MRIASDRHGRRREIGTPVIGVLIGFAVIGAVIGAGYLVGRIGILGENAASVLGRLGFFVLTPCLLFIVLADADVHDIFSSLLVVSLVAAVAAAGVYVLVARLVWKRAVPETVIGALGSGYVNANNIGIPVAYFVIGSAAYSAPVVLLQMLVFAPIALTILDVYHRGGGLSWRILLQPFRNPILIGSLLGVLVSVFELDLPEAVMEPFRLIGGAAVPVVLIAFGISLHGRRPLAPGSSRPLVGGVSNGTTSVTLSAEWFKEDPIYAYQRPYSAITFGTPTFAGSVNIGSQYYYLDPSKGAPTVTPGGLSAAALVAAGVYSGPRTAGQQFELFNLARYVTQKTQNERQATRCSSGQTETPDSARLR